MPFHRGGAFPADTTVARGPDLSARSAQRTRTIRGSFVLAQEIATRGRTGHGPRIAICSGVMNDAAAASQLRFLDNSQLESPLVEPLDVRTQAGTKIGTFDGVIVDPAERRVRYLVVDRGRVFHKRCLIPMPAARVDAEHHELRIDVDDADPTEWEQFDPVSFPKFSDEDLITAMFAPRA